MKKLILILVLFATASICGNAQVKDTTLPNYILGGFGGLNYNMHLADFKELPGVESCCPQYTGAKGFGFNAGLLFEMPINEKFYWGARLYYGTYGASFSENEAIGNTEVREAEPPFETIDIVNAYVDHTLDASIGMLSFEPRAGYYFFDKFHGFAGFGLGYMMTAEFDQQEKLTEPNNITFPDGRLIRNDETGLEIPDASKLQAFLSAGIGYDLPLSKSIFLTPELKYNYHLTNVSSVDWKITTLQFSAALKIPVYPAKEYPIIRDTTIIRDTNKIYTFEQEAGIKLIDRVVNEDEQIEAGRRLITVDILEQYEQIIPKETNFQIALKVQGISADGKKQENPTIIIEEIETEEFFPVLPYVFFNKNESELSDSGLNLLKKGEKEDFTEEDLPWKTLGIYSQMLNIVGNRMQEHPAAKITVTGCNNDIGNEKNNMDLSRNRADAVKDYLVYVWEINPSRIETEARGLPANPANNDHIDGIVENQRAEISSDTYAITKPVILKDILVKSNPPVVEISPAASSAAGIDSWNIDVAQEGDMLRDYSGMGNPAKQVWSVEELPMPELNTPVKINYSAKDNTGAEKSTSRNVNIEQLTIRKKRSGENTDIIVDKFSLILFDYDKANITQHQLKSLEEVKNRIEPDSKVTISGYADRTGDSSYNKNLAMKRCQEVQKVLDVPKAQLDIIPVGSDFLIYDNDLPQGRNYSRTVQIIIETPVEKNK